ncbi:hypothetical protein A3D85_01460 [Candidatus Amesbacteria bacterium RIFCSPHIGHO2_02_FULL_47_9]|uniref:Uncharacterized protein n=1 Tax=Candidatus Amesbacteria bacterium RIFCSPHIGHO2_01_FULL_48_32b TaxID=1797253 RepID=A0A1F4YDH6_9BACT|nr:MAG: hypothetical protein A2876_04560 [Candidatus Amesbacteria bacterium RIFCSPHIGHO2_01_FULL_48_32b]OGD04269.1 MAG: hypothetical protein A3D85_01460 [Candidatus Amesbacteria bacterium RIFCSPHIGHO2_02_FULL_47_9]OGD08209.1 MAG: hypothetical protein A2899_02985 [Candidatus Amesbacteria bacterium RIFCSPLOWO2_01_FULL_49_25]
MLPLEFNNSVEITDFLKNMGEGEWEIACRTCGEAVKVVKERGKCRARNDLCQVPNMYRRQCVLQAVDEA